MKLFVTIGTQSSFPRLIDWVQEYAINNNIEIYIQDTSVIQSEECILDRMKWADIIVAHAGIGTIIKSCILGKNLVVVPRLAHLGEQRNNHQLETCDFIREYGIAKVVENKHDLFDYLNAQSISKKDAEKAHRTNLLTTIKNQNFHIDLSGKKVIAVSSFGGHTVELNEILSTMRFFHIVRVCTNGKYDYHIDDFSRSNFWIVFKVVFQMWQIIKKENPDAIISTGAAPGLVAIVVAWLLGKETIWIDSVATRSKLSLSGRLVKPFCDFFYVQWPELSNDKIKYIGNVLGL